MSQASALDVERELKMHRDPRMEVEKQQGYLHFCPGDLAGFDVLRRTCLSLLEQRRDTAKGKKSYLTPVLATEDFMRHSEIIEYCLNPRLLVAAAAYLGEPPILRSAQLFWTSENETEAGSQQWHFDHIAPRQLKLFVYLSPVFQETGPFTFLPADVSARFLSAIGKTWDEAHVRSFSDQEVEERCGTEPIVQIIGPAGTGCLVDTTRCLHYGGRTRRGERHMVIIQYTSPAHATEDLPALPAAPDAARLSSLQRAALRIA